MPARKKIKPVVSVEAVEIEDTHVIVKDGQEYGRDILPHNRMSLERDVDVGNAARVDGFIYGKSITLESGHSELPDESTRAKGLYAEDFIDLNQFSKIATHVLCNGDIDIGESCDIFGDVIGKQKISIHDNTKIGGNVVSDGDISIGSNVWVGGYVVSTTGSVAINEGSKVFDIIAEGDIELGNNITIVDRVIKSSAGEINFFETIKAGDTEIDSQNPPTVKVATDKILSAVSKTEININELKYGNISYESEIAHLREQLTQLVESLH